MSSKDRRSESDWGQVNVNAAEVYEEFFLPALFQQWTSRIADAANIQPGQRVLDVACGTGVVARFVARRVGEAGSVVGLDRNEGMLAVARRKAPEIDWRYGLAEALPFESDSFDSVVSQFGLMFFENKPAALKEMFRVLRPGGKLAIAVWDRLEHSPGFSAITVLLQRLFGDRVADAMRMPFNLGDTQQLSSLFAEAGLPQADIKTLDGTAHFPSIQSWIRTDIKGWTLADMIDDDQFDLLLNEAEKELRSFVTAEGKVAFSAPAHIVTVIKQ